MEAITVSDIRAMMCENGAIAAYAINDEVRKLHASDTDTYCDEQIQLRQKITDMGRGLFRVEREWTNIGSASDFVFVTQIATRHAVDFSVIPNVMYDRNAFGRGNEPKGLTRDGQPWVFAYSRSGVPSTTICEGGGECTALFADTSARDSLISSCSMLELPDGRYAQRIYYPELELPVRYAYRDTYDDAVRGAIHLAQGESFAAAAYIVVCTPKYPRYGIMQVYDHACAIFKPTPDRTMTNAQIWDAALSYARDTLYQSDGGFSAFNIGCMPDENGVAKLREGGRYELGWCGQNALFARAFITDYLRTGNRAHLDIGVSVIDTWVNKNSFTSGIIGTHLPDTLSGEMPRVADTCNMGMGAYQILRAYDELKQRGTDMRHWYDYGIHLCDFFTEHYSDNYGFGKTWNVDGEPIATDGTVGIFINMALLEAYRQSGNAAYLHTAERALAFYDKRDLQRFACTAGALDTDCVDKETCCPMLNSAITLYELTGNPYYLEVAERAGYYLLSWTYLYDVIYDKPCDFTALGYRTTGATSVSAQHHHLDPWGAMISIDFERMYKVSHESKWHEWAKLLWGNAMLCIADKNTTYGGVAYPYGAQGEASFQTNWCFSDFTGENGKGSINKWFVAWPSAMRLCALIYDPEFLEK